MSKDKIILYENEAGNVELSADGDRDTLWATQSQIAEIFCTTISNINIHLKRIYSEGELSKVATIKESLIVQIEGCRSIKRPLILYNLDAIISVGYRVNSKKATQFRIWATKVLRENILGTQPQDISALHDVIDLIDGKSPKNKTKAEITLKVTKKFI